MLASHKFFQPVTVTEFMLSEWISKVAVGMHVCFISVCVCVCVCVCMRVCVGVCVCYGHVV